MHNDHFYKIKTTSKLGISIAVAAATMVTVGAISLSFAGGMMALAFLKPSKVLRVSQSHQSIAIPVNSVKYHVPSYLPDEEVGNPRHFYAGRKFRIKYDFPENISKDSVRVTLLGKDRGIKRELKVVKATSGKIDVFVPADIPGDIYDILITADTKRYTIVVPIRGVETDSSHDRRAMRAGADNEQLHEAVTEHNEVGCAGIVEGRAVSCYWESVITADPNNPETLIYAWTDKSWENSDIAPFYITRNAGRTWSPLSVNNYPDEYFSHDPQAHITVDGTILLAGMGRTDDFEGLMSHVFIGDIASDTLTQYPLREVPTFIDRPTLHYDNMHDLFYAYANIVDLNGPSRPGSLYHMLYVSSDGGVSFEEQLIGPVGLGYYVLSMGTNSRGRLRAMSISGTLLTLLRFESDTRNFNEVPAFNIASRRLGIARLSGDSMLGWRVDNGPRLSIDTSGGQHNGRMYVLWTQHEELVNDPEIEYGWYGINYNAFLAYSDDDGESWSNPIRINDDETLGDQVFPSMMIDREGTLHISFIDKRNDPLSPYYDVYYAKVQDGMVSENIKVNHESYLGHAMENGQQPGHYMEMVWGSANRVYVSYPCDKQTTGIIDGNPDSAIVTDMCISNIDSTLIPTPEPNEFIRGDVDKNGIVNINDPVTILNWLFLGQGEIPCTDAADVNDNGTVNITDAIHLLNHLFTGENGPPFAPFPKPGVDSTQDSLGCTDIEWIIGQGQGDGAGIALSQEVNKKDCEIIKEFNLENSVPQCKQFGI